MNNQFDKLTKNLAQSVTRRAALKKFGRGLASRALAYFGLALLRGPFAAHAQTYSIDWHTVDGGGGTSTGSVYSVSGTIGQPDAGAMSGGPYSLTGGFWALYAVQTPGAPKLSIARTSTNAVVVSWPSPSTGFNLQQNSNIPNTHWVPPSEPVSDNGTNKFIIVNPPVGNRFYRLKSP